MEGDKTILSLITKQLNWIWSFWKNKGDRFSMYNFIFSTGRVAHAVAKTHSDCTNAAIKFSGYELWSEMAEEPFLPFWVTLDQNSGVCLGTSEEPLDLREAEHILEEWIHQTFYIWIVFQWLWYFWLLTLFLWNLESVCFLVCMYEEVRGKFFYFLFLNKKQEIIPSACLIWHFQLNFSVSPDE